MPLITQPTEIIISIAKCLEDAADLNSWVQTCHTFYEQLNLELYRREHVPHGRHVNWAASFGRMDTMRTIIDAGVDLEQPGCDPMFFAVDGGQVEMLRLMIDVLRPDQPPATKQSLRNANLEKALCHAVVTDHVASARLLFESGVSARTDVTDPREDDVLTLAAFSARESTDIVTLVLDHVGPIDPRQAAQSKLLHDLTRRGKRPVLNAKTASLLIDRGFAVDGVSNYLDHMTPLETAIRHCNAEMAQVLLERGADPNRLVDNGKGLLTLAAVSNRPDIVKMLLTHGAEIDHIGAGETALGAAVGLRAKYGVEVLVAHGANASLTGEGNVTPLQIAVDRQDVECLATLIGASVVDLEAKDGNLRTALFHAARQASIPDLVQLLLSRGANPRTTDLWGGTPLAAAVRNAHFEAAKLLLEADATGETLRPRDCYGHTVIYWAASLRNAMKRHGDDPEIKIDNRLAMAQGARIMALLEEHAEAKGVVIDEAELEAEGSVFAFEAQTCWCDICCRNSTHGQRSYVCRECDSGEFIICQECSERGVKCQGQDHTPTWQPWRCVLDSPSEQSSWGEEERDSDDISFDEDEEENNMDFEQQE